MIVALSSAERPPGFSAAVLEPKTAAAFEAIWGPKSPLIKDEQGRANWGWAMLDKLVLARPERDLPLFAVMTKSWGLHVRRFGRGEGRLFDALRKTGQPFHANWSWGGGPPLMPDRTTGLWRGLDLTNKTPVLAFANSASSGMNLQSGNTNFYHQWKEVKDTAESFEVFLSGGSKADVTPRRLQKFKVRPGEKLRWQTKPTQSRRDKTPPKPQNGTVTVDADGVFTIRQVEIPPGGTTLTVTRAK